MVAHYVSDAELLHLISARQGKGLFCPAATNGLAWLDTDRPDASVEPLRAPRAAQSPKGLFLPATESLGTYGPAVPAATAVEAGAVVLLGVRACELRARNYLDKVLLEGEFDDPPYAARREAMTVVSCDCSDCTETCFCTLVGGRPFATEGYDVNLTPVAGGFVADAATEKGRQWLADAGGAEATGDQLGERDRLRERMTERVAAQNASFGFSASDEAAPTLPEGEDAAWQAFAADCVECGACTNICPTCHCFYLYDQALGAERFERVRTWDSCLLSTYHRMAGGENMKLSPRPRLSSRLANRVLHKFVYSLQQYGLLGCVGCGRCIDACPGAIDIRQVVQELSA